MPGDTKALRRKLRSFGFSDSAVSAAWPGWWSDEAESSESAKAELRFSLARKLGLDPRPLLTDDEPRFVWHDETKFKRISTENEQERAAISSFGTSVARALVTSTTPGLSPLGLGARRLREGILASQPFVRLVDLLGLCWALGIPVIHLRVFPLSAKRMCAMSVCVGERYAILLGKDSVYPAPVAYYLAHEIGHIALGHLGASGAVIDLQDPLQGEITDDPEEKAADEFALELLTGAPRPAITTLTKRFTARELARTVLEISNDVRIEPGTLALCFGHSSGRWATVHAALKHVYLQPRAVWTEVNQAGAREIDWTSMPDDMQLFIRAVMGAIPNGIGRR